MTFALPPTDQLIQLALILLVLIIAWGVARFVLRLTAKVFGCGCSLILLLGLILLLVRIFSNA